LGIGNGELGIDGSSPFLVPFLISPTPLTCLVGSRLGWIAFARRLSRIHVSAVAFGSGSPIEPTRRSRDAISTLGSSRGGRSSSRTYRAAHCQPAVRPFSEVAIRGRTTLPRSQGHPRQQVKRVVVLGVPSEPIVVRRAAIEPLIDHILQLEASIEPGERR